jgi:multiple sugar transport system substrate-binding protein
MKMKFKGFAAIVLSLSLVASGCSSGKQAAGTKTADGKTTPSEGGQQTISWVSHPQYGIKSPDPKRLEYVKNAVSNFEKNHPNLKLDNSQLSSTNSNESMANLMQQVTQGRAPDISMIDSFMFPQFMKNLQPLDDYLAKAGIKAEDFFPFVQNVVKGPDGKIYGLWFNTDTRVLFYRKDLIPEPPKTWDEVLTIGQQLKAKGMDPLTFPGGRGEGATITSILPFFWGQGGKLVDDQGNATFASGDNKQKMLNVLTFVNKLVQTGVTPQRVANYKIENDQNNELPSGKIAMFLGGSWQGQVLHDLLGEQEFAKWAVAPIPQMSADQHATAAGGWVYGVFTKDPAKAQAAVDFLVDTFIGDKGMGQWCDIGGWLPTRKSLYGSPNWKGTKFNDDFKLQLDKYAQTRPSAPVYSKISEQMQIALSSVISGSKSPEDALKDAQDAVSKQ